MPMNCDQAIELLPWLLNGTLEAGERDEVRRHLETCERCREALTETRVAGSIFGQHIPGSGPGRPGLGRDPLRSDPPSRSASRRPAPSAPPSWS